MCGADPNRELVVPPWAENLPCCIFALLKFFYLDLLVHDDTFEAAVRKMLIAVGPWIFVTSPLPNTIFLLLSERAGTVSGIVALCAMMMWTPLYLGLFAYAKCRPERAGDGALTDVWTMVTSALLFVSMLPKPYVAVHIPLAMTMYLAVICRAPRRGITCVFAGLAAMASIYNRAAFPLPEESEYPLIAIPDSIERRDSTMRLDLVLFLLNVPILLFLEMVLRESDRRHVASRASVELAKQLAAALSRYDTKSAAAALDDADMGSEDGAEGADAELVEGFRSIVANLDEYRPFLPNWLVNKHVAHADNLDEDLDLDSAAESARDDTESVRSARSSTGSVGSRSRKRRSDPDRNSRRSNRHDSAHVSATPLEHFGMPAGANHAVLQTRTVAVAHLEYDTSALATMRNAHRSNALHIFVDLVHEFARETGAAVHSFIGDCVVATWNAASACAQPGVKAARFAARLRTSIKKPFALAGGIAAGPGTVLMAGQGEQRALLTTLAPHEAQILQIARIEGVRRQALLVPASLARVASHVVTFQVAAVIPAQLDEPATAENPAATPPAHVFLAVCREIPPDCDDWIYVVDQDCPLGAAAAGIPDELEGSRRAKVQRRKHLEAVAEACERGDYTAAMANLGALDGSDSADLSGLLPMLGDDIDKVTHTAGVRQSRASPQEVTAAIAAADAERSANSNILTSPHLRRFLARP